MNKQTIDLDVITGGVPQVLHVSQYDTGARTLEFNIYSSNNDLDLTGATAKISGRKADGLGFEYPATITDGVVVADCTDQMTAVAGIVECAITLTNSEGQIQTARFDLNVKPAPLNDDTVISDSDFPLIQQAIGAEEDAEAWAVGTRNGEPVPVSDPTYENNAKYYAEQAEHTDVAHKISWTDADESVQKNLLTVSDVANSTETGIIFTNNQDGTYKLAGTCTASGNYLKTIFTLDGFEGYILNGAPSGSATNTYYLRVRYCVSKTNTAYVAESIDTGDGVKIEYPTGSTAFQIQLVVATRSAISNIIFKPMLRKATIKDDTWQPYILNNNQLVGWTQAEKSVKKNLIPYPYKDTTKTASGITCTDNGDGTITVNGTATASVYYNLLLANTSLPIKKGRYILSGTEANKGTVRLYLRYQGDTGWTMTTGGADTEFVIANDTVITDISLQIPNTAVVTNQTIKPMLRLASIKDDTYAPYIPDNTELTTWKANGVLGAKNLIPYPYYRASGTIVNTITFTYNANGEITVNGTNSSTSEAYYSVTDYIETDLAGKKVTLSNGGTYSNDYWLGLYTYDSSKTIIGGSTISLKTAQEDSLILPSNCKYFVIFIRVAGSKTVSNKVFKPMLRLAEDTDDTYQPYAMTNRELTALACKKTTAGTYSLQCVVDASGNKTYSWV